jgi:hypothetical protein
VTLGRLASPVLRFYLVGIAGVLLVLVLQSYFHIQVPSCTLQLFSPYAVVLLPGKRGIRLYPR